MNERITVKNNILQAEESTNALYMLLVRNPQEEYLADRETPTDEIRKVARAIRSNAEHLVAIAIELSRLADFHDATRSAEDIAARVFAKHPEDFTAHNEAQQ